MRQNKDAILAVAIAGSISAGVLVPSVGLIIEPYLLVWLGALLFLNLIKLEASDIVSTFARPRQLAVLSFVKLLVLPLAMYALAYVVYRPFALPVLLLSGISTGLGAPFVVNIVGGRLPLIVGMIITTSLAVPFVLPTLVYVLAGSEFDIPLLHMIVLLSAALFLPLAASWLTRKHLPKASDFAHKNSFMLSIVFVVLINFGMFAGLSGYFFADQEFLLQTILVTVLCFAAFGFAGFVSSINRSERTAGLISMTYVNNTLVAVFASQFFGPHVAALAALYNIPYYAGIIFIKKMVLR